MLVGAENAESWPLCGAANLKEICTMTQMPDSIDSNISLYSLNAHRTINHPLNCSFFLVHVLSFSMHIFTCPNNMICLPSLHPVQDKS
jgi:hypothetical protein